MTASSSEKSSSPIISEHFVGTLSTFEEKEIWLYGIPGINEAPPAIFYEQKPETFIITALELFIHPFDCQIWIILHHTDREYVPYFVVTCRDGSRAYKFAMDLLELPKGAILDYEDLPASCNAKWTMLLAWWGNVDKAWSMHKEGQS